MGLHVPQWQATVVTQTGPITAVRLRTQQTIAETSGVGGACWVDIADIMWMLADIRTSAMNEGMNGLHMPQ
jgi:hypothetical protein